MVFPFLNLLTKLNLLAFHVEFVLYDLFKESNKLSLVNSTRVLPVKPIEPGFKLYMHQTRLSEYAI